MTTSTRRRVGIIATVAGYVAATVLVVGGGATLITAANAAPEPTPTPTLVSFVGSSTVNGLADEQEADAAAALAAEAARVEAERVAAEAAAVAEAARVAAEQQAAADALAVEQEAAEVESFEADEPAAPSGPTLCPDGTTANAVDGAGNESNCIPNGGPSGDQMCVAMNELNECTAWLEQ